MFNYNSSYWTNKKTYAVKDGLKGILNDDTQIKLASYWNTPFEKICLGMKVEDDSQPNWIVINNTANSLFNVIADGDRKQTKAGTDAWRSLMDSSLLGNYCHGEGFNLQPNFAICSYVKVRIGLVANSQNDCNSCGSCIGFGIATRSCEGRNLTSTCGTTGVGCNDSPDENKAAFGYIFVQ